MVFTVSPCTCTPHRTAVWVMMKRDNALKNSKHQAGVRCGIRTKGNCSARRRFSRRLRRHPFYGPARFDWLKTQRELRRVLTQFPCCPQ